MNYTSVLRVFTTSMAPSFKVPWQMKSTQTSTGSAVYLGGNEILTGAHVVTDATFIQVQSLYSAEKFVARVKSISHDCDLALLELEEPELLSDLPVAKIGALPELKSRVEVTGFPKGGEQISITNGVLSRVEVSVYSHSHRALLCATIDAAINPGNSGGPVFNEQGEVVGIAFQKDMDAENSGQMVPTPVIESFLRQARKGHAEVAFPMLGVSFQQLDNPALREHFKVPKGHTGVLVSALDFGTSAWGELQVGDVIHELDEYKISNLATIEYLGKHRTEVSARLSELVEGDTVRLLISRQGELKELSLTLKRGSLLVPRNHETRNRYCVFGGLVFQPLSSQYLRSWPRFFLCPTELRYFYELGSRQQDKREMVVLTNVLSDQLNIGYDSYKHALISEVNEVPVEDFAHFVRLLDECEGMVRLKTTQGDWLIFSASEARERAPELLARYRVPEARVL